MKHLPAPVWFFVFVVLCLPLGLTWSAGTDAVATGGAATVTADTLKARLVEIESSTTLDEEARSSLTETINKSLANLETARDNKSTTDSYIQLRAAAPVQIMEIRAQLEKAKESPAEIRVSSTLDTPFEVVEQELLQEKANLAAVKAKRADLEVQLESAKGRPAVIPTQLAAAKQAREDLESEQKLPAPANELAWKTEARRWSQSTRIAALRAEISMLDQELLALPFRIDLLEVQRDQQLLSAERITVRTTLLTDLSSRQGREDARAAKIAAEAAVDDAAGKHPLIQQQAEQNAELTRDISTMTAALKESGRSYESIDRNARRIDDDFRRAREQLEVAGLNDVLGEVLRQQRQSLAEPGKLRRELKELEGNNARVTLELIQQGAELKRLRNPEGYIVELSRGLSASEIGQINNDLLELVNSRRDLLDKSINLHKSYLRSLSELATSYRHLLDASTGYYVFLAENLLWIRSAPPPGLDMITDIPAQFIWLFSPSRWLEVPGTLIAGVLNSLPVKLLLLLIVALLWNCLLYTSPSPRDRS